MHAINSVAAGARCALDAWDDIKPHDMERVVGFEGWINWGRC